MPFDARRISRPATHSPPRREARDGGGMSSEGDALGASYSLGERDYDVDASSLADPYVQEEGTGRPGISLLSVSAWAIALVSLWVYRRAVIRALQAARGGTRVSPRAALVHVRSTP
jgi:hypothetical protein